MVLEIRHMFGPAGTTLSRRERQIMEVVYRLGARPSPTSWTT